VYGLLSLIWWCLSCVLLVLRIARRIPNLLFRALLGDIALHKRLLQSYALLGRFVLLKPQYQLHALPETTVLLKLGQLLLALLEATVLLNQLLQLLVLQGRFGLLVL
jgi:hypothetical protein